MKKALLVLAILGMAATPISAEASVRQNQDNIPAQGPQSRLIMCYRFVSVPPKKFDGKNRIHYEYDKRTKTYMGYYL